MVDVVFFSIIQLFRIVMFYCVLNIIFRNLRAEAVDYMNEKRAFYEYPAIAVDDKLNNEAGSYAQHLVNTTYYRRAPVDQLNGAG